MEQPVDGAFSVTEDMVERYIKLNREMKAIEKELAKLKRHFNHYFDHTAGVKEKGELILGSFKLERQVRRSERYVDAKTVERLEALNLTDCIQVVKRPDVEKIKAAISLGILPASELEGCKEEKVQTAIYVREV